MNAQPFLREYIKSALTNEHLDPPDDFPCENPEVADKLYQAHKKGGISAAHDAWRFIIRHQPELAEVYPYSDPIGVKLKQEDVWAIRRVLAKMPLDPALNVSPVVKLMIKAMGRNELQRLVMIDGTLAEDVTRIDPNEPIGGSAGGYKLLIPFGDLEDMPLPAYAIDRYPIYERGVNMIYGTPGVGKSFIATDFIGHIAVKNPDKAIIYVAPEGWSSIPARWKAWCQHNGVDPTPPNAILMHQALRLTKPEQVAQFTDEIKAHDLKVHFIVFDTLARAMVGDNENDSREMNLFIDTLDRLRAELDCGVLLIHHVNKLGGLRGSTVLDGALDSLIKVTKEGEQLVLHNRGDKGGKNRHRPEADPVYLKLVTVEVEMRGEVDNAGVVELIEKADTVPSYMTISKRQLELLEVLDSEEKGMTVNRLFEVTQIPKPTIYRYVKQLGRGGYLHHDRSRDQVVITDNGRTVYRR
jgi:predicted transcriptional regulator